MLRVEVESGEKFFTRDTELYSLLFLLRMLEKLGKAYTVYSFDSMLLPASFDLRKEEFPNWKQFLHNDACFSLAGKMSSVRVSSMDKDDSPAIKELLSQYFSK